MPVSAQAPGKIVSALDNVTSKGSIPGMVFVSVDRNGGLVATHCSGKVGNGKPTPMSLDTVFWIASCTKMITGIACSLNKAWGSLAPNQPTLSSQASLLNGFPWPYSLLLPRCTSAHAVPAIATDAAGIPGNCFKPASP
ncbi:hypothetical protein BKA61DRAFT_702951 [Leptodontidium sp. MPI-SDFR-AT-0119]|nr:hypothetical protein BKA61DRAFT_702951 [Leptodontidium sp. MPI-SDFR-AT-0119]